GAAPQRLPTPTGGPVRRPTCWRTAPASSLVSNRRPSPSHSILPPAQPVRRTDGTRTYTEAPEEDPQALLGSGVEACRTAGLDRERRLRRAEPPYEQQPATDQHDASQRREPDDRRVVGLTSPRQTSRGRRRR